MTILYALLVLLVALLVTTVTSLYDLTIQLFTKQSWKTNVTKVPTVRTYLKYKDEYLTETYAYKVYDKGQDQLWLNLDQQSCHLALKQADIRIFQKCFLDVHLLSRKLCGK